MKHILELSIIFAILSIIACKKNSNQKDDSQTMQIITYNDSVVGDSMVYGLACDGTNDSNVVVYPFNDGDPITYSCIDAKQAGRIIGKPSIGDWVGLVLDIDDPTTARMVINLDQLKGTWTYPVKPTFKDFKNLSKRMQRRMEREALNEMPDSVKELYMVPREYGFSLKRSHKAQAVGRVFSGSSLEDDSPVEYPEVKNYTSWFMWNGKLLLVSHKRDFTKSATEQKVAPAVFDTLDFVSLDDDSLILRSHTTTYHFHRKSNALTVNAKAQKKAQQAAESKVKVENN